MLDRKLTQLGLKLKNMIVLDLSFPLLLCPEFKKTYEPRFVSLPCRQGMALGVAGGLASSGKLVVLLGYFGDELKDLDSTLNVKVIRTCTDGTWENLEDRLRAFGPAIVLIPV